MKRLLVLGLLPAFALAGCGQDNQLLLKGEYAGSTAANKAVVVDVGSDVLLDGMRMRMRPNQTWVADDDSDDSDHSHADPSMRCRMAADDTEMVCTITRDGDTETVELLRL